MNQYSIVPEDRLQEIERDICRLNDKLKETRNYIESLVKVLKHNEDEIYRELEELTGKKFPLEKL